MKKFLATMMMVVFVSGCANMLVPETPKERLAVAESTMQATQKTILDLTARRIIVPGSDKAKTVAGANSKALTALQLWRSCVSGQTSGESCVKAPSTATGALKALQTVLDTLAREAATRQ